MTNIVLENATNGYHTDITNISGQKFYPYTDNRVLVIDDNNASQYFTYIPNYFQPQNGPYDVYMNIPEEYSTFVIETTALYRIVKIQPQGGIHFDDYKKIMIIGNVVLWQGESYNNTLPNYNN